MAPPKRKAVACTHVTMERIPLDQTGLRGCPNCGSPRTLGFLYACREDIDMRYMEFQRGKMADDRQGLSSLRQELEQIGLSESVIRAAECGSYTSRQLEKLKTQKLHLNAIIAFNLRRTSDLLDLCPNEPSNNDGALNSIRSNSQLSHNCLMLACHACRPSFSERIPMSLDAIFADEIRPFHPAEASFLPTKSASIMQDIGLHTWTSSYSSTGNIAPYLIQPENGATACSSVISSQSSLLTYKTTQSEVDSLDATRSHRRHFYRMGRRSSYEIARDVSRLPRSRRGLKSTLQAIFRSSRESSSSGSNITLPMPRTAAARDAENNVSMREFDMGALRRVKRQKEQNDLKKGTCMGDIEGIPEHPFMHDLVQETVTVRTSPVDEDSDCSNSDYSVYTSMSEGSEIEVEGGVALTEEAVETHTPDLVNISSPGLVDELDDKQADLNGVMTQV